MTIINKALIVVATATLVLGQRPSFAGFRPIGYPDPTTSTSSTTPAADDLGNRFGDGDNATTTSTTTTTTQRIPIEANGDRDLIDRLSKMPIDKQPFWFINWQALEAHRNKPQTYPLRPSSFAQHFHPTNPEAGSTGQTSSGLSNDLGGVGSGNANSNTGGTGSNSDFASPQTNSGTRNIDVATLLSNNQGLGTPNFPGRLPVKSRVI